MKITLLLVGLFFAFAGFSQEVDNELTEKQNFIISAAYGNGSTMATNPFVEGDNLQGKPIENYQFFSLKALWQNPGYKDWQKVYKGPYYGFGFSIGDFYNPKEIGYPISCYGVLGIPIFRLKKLELFSEAQFGFAANWKAYDSIANPKNIVIGGGLTVHLDIALKMHYNLNKHFDIGAGVSFVHFSNGGFERPNRGFNIYSPFAEVRYRFAKRPNYKNIEKPKNLKKYNDLYFMLGYGDHQLVEHELDSNYFAVAGLSVIYFKQISNGFRIGGGTDFNYWWGLNANNDGTIGARKAENLTIGLIIQPEMIINKMTLVGGIGVYALHLHYGNFQQTYQRLGVRFDVYKNWSFGINVRAVNFMLAELMEFNIGYKIRWER